MRKVLVLLICSILFLTSCGTYTGEGAAVGSYAGSIFGSAIGGIIGGPRGSDVGTLVGMAGGAVVGASVGAAADQKVASDYQNYQVERANNGHSQDKNGNNNDSDCNYTPGDDRINMYNDDAYSGNYSAVTPRIYTPSTDLNVNSGFSYKLNSALEIIHLRFVDANRDKSINADEECKMIFEIMNRSNSVLYDIQPIVVESTGNKHIFISPGIHVESILPGTGIRYTAMVKADKRLKDGMAIFHVSALQGNGITTSKISEIEIPTVSLR
jgi:hypothetical protein